MKYLGVGLSKTGTTSLHQAFKLLGLKSIHHDRERLNQVLGGEDTAPDFRVYDDVDVVSDLPSAFFFRELLSAYPDAKAILTVRDTDSWLRSWANHVQRINLRNSRIHERIWKQMKMLIGLANRPKDVFKRKLLLKNQLHVYGSKDFQEDINRRKYEEHIASVKREIPPDRLLVMDVIGGDGWDKLCSFVGLDPPDEPFPHSNVSRYKKRRQAVRKIA